MGMLMGGAFIVVDSFRRGVIHGIDWLRFLTGICYDCSRLTFVTKLYFDRWNNNSLFFQAFF